MKVFTTNTPGSAELERFYIQSNYTESGCMYSVLPTNKRNKVTWKYKRSAIKAFVREIACRHSWFGNVNYSSLYDIEIQLVDRETKEVLCKARLHNDEEYVYVPRYSITPIDPIAKEYYKSK